MPPGCGAPVNIHPRYRPVEDVQLPEIEESESESMISTAAYYCTSGHVWEWTGTTWYHADVQGSLCHFEERCGAKVHGPFYDIDAARRIAVRRGVLEIAGSQEHQEGGHQ
jgi:hypothetical protein